MPTEPLLAGIFDPRGTLGADRARAQVAEALAFFGPARIEQWGPVTVGIAGADGARAASDSSSVRCIVEGEPRLDGTWASAAQLAAGWRREGDVFLTRLRGSFLLVLWDTEAERGILARDQMGQRPLLWHGGGSRLAFAGDFRPLLGLVNPRPGPDETTVACWLGSRVPDGDRTMFEGVRRLPGGHLVRLDDAPPTPHAFWRPQYQQPLEGSRDDLLAGMIDRLETATASVLDGARQPGVLLSGGIDSTAVAALAEPLANDAGLSLRSYSATFPDLPEADESELVAELVNALGLHNASMAVHGGSLLAGLLRYTQQWHMPDVSANNFFWIDLLRLAGQDGVDVLLDGEGGDELFLVPRFYLADLIRAGRLRTAWRLVGSWPAMGGHPSARARARILRQYGIAGILPHAAGRALWSLRPRNSPLPLSPLAERMSRKGSDPAAWKRGDGPRWWRNLAYHMTAGPDSFGAPEHALRIARMAGVRRRRPLLDLDLSEYMLRLPPTLAFSPWYTKGHVRAALLDRVPEPILFQRGKTVFTDVRFRSLAPDLPFARRLLGKDAEVRRYVLRETIDEVVAGRPGQGSALDLATWGFRLQHLAGTELWLRVLRDPSAVERAAGSGGFEPLRYDLTVKDP
jgi:asparagine synthase (glutamine-hydrolysing)